MQQILGNIIIILSVSAPAT